MGLDFVLVERQCRRRLRIVVHRQHDAVGIRIVVLLFDEIEDNFDILFVERFVVSVLGHGESGVGGLLLWDIDTLKSLVHGE
jgi:hypothetical protein